MSPKVTLHGFIVSPPARGSMLSCEALGVEYELKNIDVTKLEHHSPEYLKINPIHSIPTLVDGDYILYDSQAISCYLANKYGKSDEWYPKDPCQRGTVDQRLYFNCSVLGPAFKNMALPLLFGKEVQPKAVAKVEEAMQFLDKLLGDSQFIALDRPTIADCHCAATVHSVQIMMPKSLTPRVAEWMKRCERVLPGYEKVNGPATVQIKAIGGGMLTSPM